MGRHMLFFLAKFSLYNGNRETYTLSALSSPASYLKWLSSQWESFFPTLHLLPLAEHILSGS